MENIPNAESTENEKLTLESINAAAMAGTPLRVKVRADSGAFEDDWEAVIAVPSTGGVMVEKTTKKGNRVSQGVPLAELQEWNK